MLQLTCNRLVQLKCNHCLSLLNQSKDTRFQAIVRKKTGSWNWCFLTCTCRTGSETQDVKKVCVISEQACLTLPGADGRHPSGLCRKPPQHRLMGVATKVAKVRTSGQWRSSPRCYQFFSQLSSLCLSQASSSAPAVSSVHHVLPSLHLLYCLVFLALFLSPVFSLILSKGMTE